MIDDEEDYLLEVLVSDVEMKPPINQTERLRTARLEFKQQKSDITLWLENKQDKEKRKIEMKPNFFDPNKGAVIIAVKFLHLPWLEIREDQSKNTEKEKREKRELERIWGRARALSKEEEIKRAHAARLTLKEWKDIQSMKRQSIMKRFKKGKSTFFSMKHRHLVQLLIEGNVTFNLFREDDLEKNFEGSIQLSFPIEFINSVCVAHQSSALRSMIGWQGQVYYPSSYYKNLQSIKKANEQEKYKNYDRRSYKINDEMYDRENLSQMKPYCKFQNEYSMDELSKTCYYCNGCGCNPSRLTAIKSLTKQKVVFQKMAEMLESSPDPIRPLPLPRTASIDGFQVFIDENGNETASLQIFIRLTCFGNSLRSKHKQNLDECDVQNDDWKNYG